MSSTMGRLLEYPFDNGLIMRKRKAIRRELLSQEHLMEKHIAVLGGSTTHDIKEILELFLLQQGIQPLFYESEYAQYWQDAVFENMELERFQPDIVFIHTSNRNISRFPELTDSEDEVEALLAGQLEHFTVMWDKLAETYHCPVIQNNFEYPFYRFMGNQDVSNIHGRVSFINRLNMGFAEYAQAHAQFFINDINYQSALYGLEQWSDPFYWYMYKSALCMDAVPVLAFNVSNIIKSLFGKNKKALALDLDHTLWGGIVGDDGVENLEIGQETSKGQAYAEFQQYLKQLQKQGILLNIVSKNEYGNALAGLNHPQMVLKPDDFIVVKADWEPKSRNLVQIAEELALLPESFVFVDDNPAEREIIRQQVPGTAVPEMENVEQYICAIDHAGYFEMTNLSSDDLKRSDMYKENIARIRQQNSFDNYEDYLLSLEMKAVIRSFEPVYESRIAQLTNKSNQFNLTTKRYTQDEIAQMAEDANYITLYGRLEDCFGDNGIVSVVIGRIQNRELHIILWLMSCRVLKRDMEYAMMDILVRTCREKDISMIYGYYYPTAKNGMVKDFYGLLDFQKIQDDADGNSKWQFEVTDRYQGKNKVIKVED